MSEDDSDQSSPLNDLAADLVQQLLNHLEEFRIEEISGVGQGTIIDFGVDSTGSLAAGLALSEICMAGLCDVSIQQGMIGDIHWPRLQVVTDNPVEACLLSQYGGWQIKTKTYYAIGSGPMRAAAAKEVLFTALDYSEEATGVVGILETAELPGQDIVNMIAEDCNVPADSVTLLVAPTASLAGTMQVVSRSVETALHKLHELKFDVTRIDSAVGSAPIPPVGATDMVAIGLTNDAILYGGLVTLWVTGDDESIEEIGPKIPSCSSPDYGRPFLEIFEAADRDFYKINPLLFSPAQVVIHNLDTGRIHCFGKSNEAVLKTSFGIPA